LFPAGLLGEVCKEKQKDDDASDLEAQAPNHDMYAFPFKVEVVGYFYHCPATSLQEERDEVTADGVNREPQYQR